MYQAKALFQNAYMLATYNDLCIVGPPFLRYLKATPLFQTLFHNDSMVLPKHRLRDLVTKQKKSAEKTVVTPAIYEIAKTLFVPELFDVVGSPLSTPAPVDDTPSHAHAVHEGAIRSMVWVSETQTAPNHYWAVELDGVRYEVSVLHTHCYSLSWHVPHL